MKLDFEIIKEVGTGNYPDLLHFANTQGQVLYISDGELKGKPTNKINNGEWENTIFQDEINISPDVNLSHFQVDVLPGFGVVGGYKTGNIHKLLIYEFTFEMDRYLSGGSIKHSIDNPISSFTLSLENPDIKDPEKLGNVAVNEENSLLSPGAKVKFLFSMGDSEEYELGSFYIDRSNFTLLSETANVDGRNLIGKALRDQTVDEANEYWYDTLSNILATMLESAGINRDNFIVENTSKQHWFTFSPNTNYFKAMQEILTLLNGWKLSELTDGTIVVSDSDSVILPPKSQYVFYRNKDIFSRNIVRDDGEVYRRVCVSTESQGFMVYKDIEVYEGWSLEAKKTLYVSVADGTSYNNVENYANELKTMLENSGKVESFTGPFRPQLICGDEAVIVGESGSKTLGLITEIAHSFGKGGFGTNFTVDSGGRIGKGRISDYIKKIASGSIDGSKTGSSDIDTSSETYRNIAKQGKIITPQMLWLDSLVNGIDDGDISNMWVGSTDGSRQDFIIFDFKQRCIINKIVVHRKYLLREIIIEYWNGAIWKPLSVILGSGDFIVEKTFDSIETSKVRFRFLPNQSLIILSEISIWGWM